MAAPFTVLIMAAGQGTRMRSDVPKVLHRVAGKTLVEWVVDSARAAGAARVVAIVRPGDGVAEGLPDGVEIAEQREGEGTGAAVLAARDAVLGGGNGGGTVVVMSGDHPLITTEQVEGLIAEHESRGPARSRRLWARRARLERCRGTRLRDQVPRGSVS
jgi:bifunctional UDP-N-acetylglucosamine pyrophosphorylase / glucosamine-1-phosphate N-acetyltransferase